MLLVKYVPNPGADVISQLLVCSEDHLSCIFQQLQASACAEDMPATVASGASVLASSHKTSFHGGETFTAWPPGQCNTKNVTGSLPRPVEMQLCIFVARGLKR